MPIKKEKCGICGEDINIEVTEDGKAFDGQFGKTDSGEKAHMECVRNRGMEKRAHNPNLR